MYPGCLECRKFEAFREIDIFKTPPPVSFPYICSENDSIDGPMPRMTRVCTKCLSSFTPWVKYDFVCRRFKCETRLVPSDIAERKRYCLLASSRSPLLKIIPEDGLAAIIDFLGGDELCNLFRTSSNMCLVVERVARARVEAAAYQFPSGPICVSSRKFFMRDNEHAADAQASADPRAEIRRWVYATNENDFGLRAPDDSKTWTGIYHYMEKMTAENYYFDFQSQHDGGAVCRFIAEPMEEKFTFGRTAYTKVGQHLMAIPIPRGITVKGGQVAVFDESRLMNNHIFVSKEVLMLSGEEKQRFIGRIFVPSSGGLTPPTRDILGAVGFLRIHRNRPDGEQGPSATWGQKSYIIEGCLRDDSVFGIEYDPANRSLMVHTFGFTRSNISQSSAILMSADDAASGDDIVLAVELTAKASKEHTLLSIRKCDNEAWTHFLEHLPPETPREELAAVAEVVFMGFDDANANANDVEQGGIIRRIRRRVAARRQEGGMRLRNRAVPNVQNVAQRAYDDEMEVVEVVNMDVGEPQDAGWGRM